MGSFTSLVAGAIMKASDVNQLIDAMNGTTIASLSVYGGAGTGSPVIGAKLPSGVASGSNWYQCLVSGDSYPRMSAYINASGYGSIAAGPGGTTLPTAHMEGNATGWTFIESVIFSNGTSIGSASTWGGLAVTGTATVTGNTTLNGGSGTVNIAAAAIAGGGNWWVGTNNASWSTTDTSGATTFLPARATSGASLKREVALHGIVAGGGWGASLNMNQDASVTANGQINLKRYNAGSSSLNGFTSASLTIAGTSATVSHGLSVAPDCVTASTGTTGSTSSWSECSVDSYGSSTVVVHVGGSGFGVYCIFYDN